MTQFIHALHRREMHQQDHYNENQDAHDRLPSVTAT